MSLSVPARSLGASGGARLSRAQDLAVLEDLRRLSPEQRRLVLASFPAAMVRALAEEWWWRAHGGQIEPEAAADGESW